MTAILYQSSILFYRCSLLPFLIHLLLYLFFSFQRPEGNSKINHLYQCALDSMFTLHRARKDYIRMKLQQRRTREGPPPTLLDPLSSQVLPLIRKELEPIDKAWDRDAGLRVEALLQESGKSFIVAISCYLLTV